MNNYCYKCCNCAEFDAECCAKITKLTFNAVGKNIDSNKVLIKIIIYLNVLIMTVA